MRPSHSGQAMVNATGPDGAASDPEGAGTSGAAWPNGRILRTSVT